ncbi:unnamed protein product [Lactuca virosa]|uniref:Uncharacterized protein n=1 Tax=Lactuca virosa TaxID=75947 RepID=A0AAU9N9C2_9ASTR|nr:unnamed protein product [Lactuca virosa]
MHYGDHWKKPIQPERYDFGAFWERHILPGKTIFLRKRNKKNYRSVKAFYRSVHRSDGAGAGNGSGKLPARRNTAPPARGSMNEGGVLRRSIDHPLLHAISCLSTATVAVVFGAADDGRTHTKSHRAKTPL